jgi:uncharacterized UPF0146 family protein
MANQVINIGINLGIICIVIGILLLVSHNILLNSIDICKKNINMYKNDTIEWRDKLYDQSLNKKKEETIIYSDRPTNTFKKMFLEPTIWLGYQNV